MTTQTNPITEYVEGTVSRINGHGFQLVGRDGWLNVSKYANPAPELPSEGASVRIGLDKAGFVRSIEQLAAGPEVEPTPVGNVDRETRIGRMAALNTATAILSSGGQQASVKDVLTLAGQLEAWGSR